MQTALPCNITQPYLWRLFASPFFLSPCLLPLPSARLTLLGTCLQVMEACDSDSVTLNGIYCLPLEGIPEGEFGSGMVTLLGDAAHSM